MGDLLEGNVQCPDCASIICVSEKGCNVVTCRNHSPNFLHFCFHCKKVAETEYTICDCPKRNTRQTRAQAQKVRNKKAKENPILLLDDSSTSSIENSEEATMRAPNEDESKRKARSPLPTDDDTGPSNNTTISGGNTRARIDGTGEEEKGEDTKPDAQSGTDGASSVYAEKEKNPRVLVEFKFRSYPTHLFQEGDLQGRMRIPMDQDPVTGLSPSQ